jgi:hypothetical protein
MTSRLPQEAWHGDLQNVGACVGKQLPHDATTPEKQETSSQACATETAETPAGLTKQHTTPSATAAASWLTLHLTIAPVHLLTPSDAH